MIELCFISNDPHDHLSKISHLNLEAVHCGKYTVSSLVETYSRLEYPCENSIVGPNSALQKNLVVELWLLVTISKSCMRPLFELANIYVIVTGNHISQPEITTDLGRAKLLIRISSW